MDGIKHIVEAAITEIDAEISWQHPHKLKLWAKRHKDTGVKLIEQIEKYGKQVQH